MPQPKLELGKERKLKKKESNKKYVETHKDTINEKRKINRALKKEKLEDLGDGEIKTPLLKPKKGVGKKVEPDWE